MTAADLHRVTITQPTSAIRAQSSKAVGLHPANQPFHPERSGASIITWPTVARR
jgi:hypothetical protein